MEILRTNELEYSYRNKYQIVNALRGVSSHGPLRLRQDYVP